MQFPPLKLHPDAQVINYIRRKCDLPPDQIEKKLLNGEIFDIKGQGNDLDTKLMEQVLKDNQFYQKISQKLLKDETMKFVKSIVEQWSKSIAQNLMRITFHEINNYTAKLLPFGSYVLDLRSNSSDIDLICVCPNFINRQIHFFTDLYQKILQNLQVKNLSARTNAKVPIITFNYKQIDIDISFCQLTTDTVPRDIQKVITAELINSITDDKSKISLLGRKNNLMILQLTGKQIDNFKQTLRVIKVWAKNRGISSNVMGYLGGISWAILVAKICQIFPNHKPSKLLSEFFVIYSIWNWKNMPVHIMPQTTQEFKKSMMCIVTPGSSYNSTERVNEITYKVLCDEIKRANEILISKKDVHEVCRKDDFLNRYPLFIEIDICGQNSSKDEQQQYKDFQGNVESKILKLLQNLIKYHRKFIDDNTFKVVPNPRLFKKQDKKYPLCNCYLFGIDMNEGFEVNIMRAVKQWCASIIAVKGNKKFLNVRIFECPKQELNDLDLNQPKKKKQEKQDPRLAIRIAKKIN